MGKTDEELRDSYDEDREQRQAQADEWHDAHDDTEGWYAGKQQKDMKKKLAGTSTFEGEREDTMEAEVQATLAPLSLGEQYLRVAGPKVAQFQDAFNLYRLPMSLTLEAVGRVQDIRSVGGPESPTEMNKEQKIRFHPFTNKDHDQKQDYHHWKDEKEATESSFKTHMGHAQQLQGVQKKWTAVQYILQRQKKTKEKDDVQKKLDNLNADAEFVGLVIDLTKTLVTVGGGGPPDTGPIVTLIKAMGGGYGFQAKIARLQQDIDVLNFKTESADIAATKDVLFGLIREYEGGAKTFQDHKTSMRKNAALMADTTGESEEGQNLRVATLVAEAYQELRMFGEAAHKEAKNVVPLIPAAQAASEKYKSQIMKFQRAERKWKSDYSEAPDPVLNDKESQDAAAVNGAGRAVLGYEKLLDKELADWRAKEKAWSAFFAKNDI